MPHNVRTHTRRTASGKTVTVRQHDRKGGSGQPAATGGKSPKRLAVISCAAGVMLVAAIVTGLPLLMLSAALMMLSAFLTLIGLLHTPKVRRKPQREDWWDDGGRG